MGEGCSVWDALSLGSLFRCLGGKVKEAESGVGERSGLKRQIGNHKQLPLFKAQRRLEATEGMRTGGKEEGKQPGAQ